MQSLWKDGTFAEKVLWPAECLTPLEGTESIPPEQLANLSYLTIAYGALLRGDFRPSQKIVVNGATGGLGVSSVITALAMGASKIVAVGRDLDTLEKVQQLDPKRIVTATLSGSYSEYAERIDEAAGGADMVIDMLGGVTTPEPTMACINALRPRGTAVLMGGVHADIPLPYLAIMLKEITVRGAFMYPRHAPGDLLRMITAGVLNLKSARAHVLPLNKINEAITEASKLKGIDYCVINP
jgi:alcohol dehydrogenase